MYLLRIKIKIKKKKNEEQIHVLLFLIVCLKGRRKEGISIDKEDFSKEQNFYYFLLQDKHNII